MKNPAFGYWTEKETNWSDKDTEFVKKKKPFQFHTKNY